MSASAKPPFRILREHSRRFHLLRPQRVVPASHPLTIIQVTPVYPRITPARAPEARIAGVSYAGKFPTNDEVVRLAATHSHHVVRVVAQTE